MLSVRLKAIADCVPEGTIVADIGTDHAFLPVELIASGKIERAYACDIGTGPLEHARATVAEAGLQAQISLILTPGLEKVPQDAQVAVNISLCALEAFFLASRQLLQRCGSFWKPLSA
mgnify:CR=1 FL=1